MRLFKLARNALIVVVSAGAVAIFMQYDMKPFSLPKKLPAGLPPFKPPAFSVSDGNTTYTAGDIFSVPTHTFKCSCNSTAAIFTVFSVFLCLCRH